MGTTVFSYVDGITFVVILIGFVLQRVGVHPQLKLLKIPQQTLIHRYDRYQGMANLQWTFYERITIVFH